MAKISGIMKSLRDIMRMDPGISGDAQRIEQISWILFLKIYDTREKDWEFKDDNYESIIPDECQWKNLATPDPSGKTITGEELLNFVNNKLFPTLKTLTVDATTPVKKAIILDINENDKYDVILMNPPYGGSEKTDIKELFPKDL